MVVLKVYKVFIGNLKKCFICFENYKQSEFIKLGCNHEFCKDCTKKALRSDKRPKPCCAYCRTEVTKLISKNGTLASNPKYAKHLSSLLPSYI